MREVLLFLIVDAVFFLLPHRLIGWGQIRRDVVYKPPTSSRRWNSNIIKFYDFFSLLINSKNILVIFGCKNYNNNYYALCMAPFIFYASTIIIPCCSDDLYRMVYNCVSWCRHKITRSLHENSLCVDAAYLYMSKEVIYMPYGLLTTPTPRADATAHAEAQSWKGSSNHKTQY